MRNPLYPSFKTVVVPAEHGSWFWLLWPFAAGTLIGIIDTHNKAPGAGSAALLVLIGGLAGFLLRRPTASFLTNLRGKRTVRHIAAVQRWLITLTLIAALSLLGLLLLGRTHLLWLMPPAIALFALSLYASQLGRKGSRALWTELAGAAGLALTAPAALAAWQGSLTKVGASLWLLFALQNMLGVLYVRLRIQDSKHPLIARPTISVRTAHSMALLLTMLLISTGTLPLLVIAPFAFYWLRALWAVHEPRPIKDIKQFGLLEAGVTAAAVIWIAFAFSFAIN